MAYFSNQNLSTFSILSEWIENLRAAHQGSSILSEAAEAALYFQYESFNLPRLKFYFTNILDLWLEQTGLSFWTIELFYNWVFEENRVFYNWVCMHIESRDKSLSINFCSIIGYPRTNLAFHAPSALSFKKRNIWKQGRDMILKVHLKIGRVISSIYVESERTFYPM